MLMSLNNKKIKDSLSSYSVGNTTIAFNSASKNRLVQAFQTVPLPDMVLMGIRGPGAPKNGRWIWTNRMLYLGSYYNIWFKYLLYFFSISTYIPGCLFFLFTKSNNIFC